MSWIMSAILLIVLFLVLALVLSLVATLGVVAVGWVATQVFADLSLFQASLIALAISAALLILSYRIVFAASRAMPLAIDEDWEEEDDEEPEPPIVAWRRSKLTDQPPAKPSGSSKSKKRR